MKYSASEILSFTAYRDLFSDDAKQAKKERKTLLGEGMKVTPDMVYELLLKC